MNLNADRQKKFPEILADFQKGVKLDSLLPKNADQIAFYRWAKKQPKPPQTEVTKEEDWDKVDKESALYYYMLQTAILKAEESVAWLRLAFYLNNPDRGVCLYDKALGEKHLNLWELRKSPNFCKILLEADEYEILFYLEDVCRHHLDNPEYALALAEEQRDWSESSWKEDLEGARKYIETHEGKDLIVNGYQLPKLRKRKAKVEVALVPVEGEGAPTPSK